MLGILKLPLRNGKHYIVTGGPFNECNPRMIGIKMAQEIRKPCHIDIGTQDFKTPSPVLLRQGLTEAVRHLTEGKPLYVGCMAGKGRTGLFMAVLTKAMGIENPVEYVRKNYYAHAVETQQQYEFVMNFPIPEEVTKMLASARRRSYFTFRTVLTDMPGATRPTFRQFLASLLPTRA